MPANAPPVTLMLDARDAARALSVCERTLRDLAARGEIHPVRIGRRCVRYSVADLTAWIERQQSNP